MRGERSALDVVSLERNLDRTFFNKLSAISNFILYSAKLHDATNCLLFFLGFFLLFFCGFLFSQAPVSHVVF